MFRYLGQHFLKNKTAINKIIAALELSDGDTIIEIGPGRGALTIPLVARCQMSDIRCQIVGIEKDPKLAYRVQRLGYSERNLKIINGDALKLLPQITKRYTLNAKRFKVVGNIPYYITGKLLRVLGDLITHYSLPARNATHSATGGPITNIVLMVQKEVAERITAKTGEMNLLAAAVQFWAKPKTLLTLKSQDFDPPPEVQSTVIKLTPRNITHNSSLVTRYYKLIKIIFKQPRKTLVNNLAAGLKTSSRGGSPPDGRAGVLGGKKEDILAILKKNDLSPRARPQDLDVQKIISLSQSL